MGCATLLVLIVGGIILLTSFLPDFFTVQREMEFVSVEQTAVPGAGATQQAIPQLTVPAGDGRVNVGLGDLTSLYEQVNPGVVSLVVQVQRGTQTGLGAGSGFILNEQGYIVTNNHVVAGAETIIVRFYNGFEAAAEVVGTDGDSDLAVIRASELAEGAHPLVLGDSDQVQVGEWVVAIGNPFGEYGGSMTIGVVSALGRAIASGATPFNIPQAIQTDAAINPGNSGGPLLNLNGEVIGVNAQIATRGVAANAGVGFAIPSNVVRRIAPVLIGEGFYEWPWLGVEGFGVGLLVAQANDLPTQQGAYLDGIVNNGPADRAGLRGSTGAVQINGQRIPVGGDVVVEANGAPVENFEELLTQVTMMSPGDVIELTVLRGGELREFDVELAPRPTDTEF
jgi:2-alkenal reductase